MGNPKRGTRSLRWRTATGVIACSTTLSLVCTVAAPSARAQESGSSATALVAAISDAQSRVDAINLTIGDLRESVNQSLVDLHDAQSRAEQARRGAEEARARLVETQAAVDAARRELADVTRLHYRSQGSPSALAGGAGDRKDVLERSMYTRQQVEEKQARLDEVERARTAAANEESTLRDASRLADESAAKAADAEQAARSALETNQRELAEQETERDRASAELADAQAKLDDVRPAGRKGQMPAESTGEDEAQTTKPTSPADSRDTAPAEPTPSPASPEPVPAPSPEVVSAVREQLAQEAEGPVPGDEELANAVTTAMLALQQGDDGSSDPVSQAAAIAATAALVGSSQADHASLENPYSGSSSSEAIAAFSSGLASIVGSGDTVSPGVENVLPEVEDAESVSDDLSGGLSNPGADSSDESADTGSDTGSDAAPDSALVETVIARAQSMVGTPYVWGGGDANGPTAGLNGGGTKGFDCSGLVLYAFAAAGISLPHYSGYQYQRGTQIDPSDAQRGDLLFWGPEGSQHVAIYLGDGTMIEAPQSGQDVQVSPVRWSGMSAKAVRLL